VLAIALRAPTWGGSRNEPGVPRLGSFHAFENASSQASCCAWGLSGTPFRASTRAFCAQSRFLSGRRERVERNRGRI